MKVQTEKNQGELKIIFEECPAGNISLSDLGINEEDLSFESGHIRFLFDFSKTNSFRKFYDTPTLRVEYHEAMAETHWQCDYNEKTILDKKDHHGHSTILLLNRKEIENLEHHHENKLIVHAEFPEAVHLKANETQLHFFK
ncbi:MAG: hypothetical protein ABJG68_17230 [Crocinitomicaceae bacterium]